MSTSIDDYVAALQLQPTGPGTFTAPNVSFGHGGPVFGGQLMAQTIIAALAGQEGKTVKTVQIIFARGGDTSVPIEITVEPLHSGRSFASSTVTISQGDRVCTRALVLLSADEPDLIRHAVEPTVTSAPADAAEGAHLPGAWEVRTVDGVDINDPDAVGPAELDVWTRFVGAPTDAATGQALLAFATDGFLIGTAMRPHDGVGQAQAHVTLTTGVVGHTLTFHEPSRADQWMLLEHESPYAGHGRAYGRAHVFQDGALVASFVQDSMIRATPPRS
ncbi:acyl-CoA thioesterase [Aquihabitans sp. McL0605]|uniref:acyl-CoA thioesterase n=1 Tax=Aquihabitans sp. McL0605 TaxID=3415671 RepID=UPI003CF22F84